MLQILYESFIDALMLGQINLRDDPVFVLLTGPGYVPDQAHATLDDVTDEVAGQGYTAGGQELSGRDVLSGVFTADNARWENSRIRARGAVLYVRGSTAEKSPLIACLDFGEEIVSRDKEFELIWGPAVLDIKQRVSE